MKKIVLLISIILISLSIFSTEYIIRDTEKDITVNKQLNEYQILLNSFSINNIDDYISINLDGSEIFFETGKPILPVIRFYIDGGQYEDINIIINDSLIIKIKENKKINPAPVSILKTSSKKIEYIDEELYNKDACYPSFQYKITDMGYIMGKRKTMIEIYPFSYNPVQNIITAYTYIIINSNSIAIDAETNWGELPAVYLFVLPSEYLAAAIPLIEWKRNKGFITKIIVTDSVGSTNNEIKSAIQNFYDNSVFPLKYVLLIGDIDKIPNFIGTEMNLPPTDLYYSTLEGTDYFPDVYVGRLPVEDTTDIELMTNKILLYEQALWDSTDDWANKAYLMATDDGGFHLLAEATQNYAAYKLRTLPMTVDSFYDFYYTGTPVNEAFNTGRAMGIYTGHGLQTLWGGPPFNQANVNALTNFQNLSLVYSFSCLTGNYAYSSECFGETWIRANGGAISFIGSSVNSLWYEDDAMERALIRAIADSSYSINGQLLNYSKMAVYNQYSGGGYSKRYFEMYNILGDPSLSIYWDIYGELSIITDYIVPLLEDSIRVYISNGINPVNNAMVSLIFNDTLINSNYSDFTGYLSFNNSFNAGDTLIIYATAHNYKMDSTVIIIEDTDHNALLTNLQFTENIFSLNIADGIFSAGDMGYIKPEIKNTGTDTLFNVYFTIRSEFERISINDTLLFIADTILPGQTVFANDSTLTIVSDTLNPFFTENFYCGIISDSLIKSFTLFREIKAPLLEYSERNIINKSDNIIISGDTLLIVFGINNSGNYDDRGIYMHFENTSPLLEIPIDTLYIPHIPFENTGLTDTVQFIINDTISTFKIVNYNIFINDSLGNNYTIKDSFIINRLDYLVIDYDNNNNSGPFIDSVLTVLGYNGNYKTDINRSELYQYKNVFMCRGVYPNATFLSGTDSIASLIDTLLDNGDINFYMEGGECWYYDVVDLGGFSFNEKCGINPINDGGNITGNIDGIDPYIANSMSFAYSGDNSYLDFINDTVTGRNIFINGSNIHGVSNIGSSYRSVGLSFELAGLTDASSPSLRSELLNNIMNFFNGLTGIIDTKFRDNQFKFEMIRNNPFSRNIVFRINGEPGLEIKINIYDITGRMIYKNNIILNSKTNNLKWNGANELPGGIYFIKAITSTGEQIKSKIIFID